MHARTSEPLLLSSSKGRKERFSQLSTFDPDPKEHDEDGDYVESVESGEPLPELPDQGKLELTARLYRIGARVFRSADHRDGWEDAYNAFAEAFERHGKLTPRQYEYDLPNMVFNFALKYDWFPHLKYVGFTDPAIDEPRRLGGPHLWLKADDSVESVSQSIEWFNERLRPALIERRAKAFEEEVRYSAFREEVLGFAGREVSDPDLPLDQKAEVGGTTASPQFDLPLATTSQQRSPLNANDSRKRRAERVKKEWPDKYPDGTETPKGVLDRRRIHGLRLEWIAFAKRVENEWIKRESQHRKETGLEATDKLGFSVDLLMAMRRGHTPGQRRLEAVAAALSDEKVTVSPESLKWRVDSAVK